MQVSHQLLLLLSMARQEVSTKFSEPYIPLAAEFSVEDGLLMRGCRIVIPQSLQQEILTKLHMAHQGITKCHDRARGTCEICCKEQYQRAESLIPSELPELLWRKLIRISLNRRTATTYSLWTYYSRFIEVVKLNRSTATKVINRMKTIFARHGIPA